MDVQRLRMMLMKCKSSVAVLMLLEFEKSSSILLSCLSQMSISVIIMFNVGANKRIQKFVFNFIGSYKLGKELKVIQKYSDLFLLLHGPKIRDADKAV